VPGLGPAKYAVFQAALELGRRHIAEAMAPGTKLDHPSSAYLFLRSQLRDYPNEVFAAMFLDTQCRVLEFLPMFHGTVNATPVYPRELIRKAIGLNASAVIVAHNHPSGSTQPSSQDRILTRHLHKALDLVGIKLLDHIIVGDNQCLSFAEQGWLEQQPEPDQCFA